MARRGSGSSTSHLHGLSHLGGLVTRSPPQGTDSRDEPQKHFTSTVSGHG